MIEAGRYIFEHSGDTALLTPYPERYQQLELTGDVGEKLIALALSARIDGVIKTIPCDLCILIDQLGSISFIWSDL